MDPPHDEEVQLMTTLSSLEGTTSRHITELFGSSLDDRAAFNAQSTRIREDLAALRAATRDLAILAEEQDTEEQASRLAEALNGHQAEYEKLQTAFKQANVQARRNTEAAAVEARKAMLAGGQAHTAPARAAGQADAVAASQGITKSLLRTRQLMAQELEHTSATLAAMDASNERLAEGREELRGHRSLFSGSRQLLRALFRSSVLDSISLYGGLAIFFLVVAYILQKRTLYFAPIGKVMAPVAGTAWNASRSAAQRAGQLPSAVLALHRRLNAKGHGAPLLVDEELPASVDRLLQEDPTGDSHLDEAWKQQSPPPDERPEADAGASSSSDDSTQQWVEAEPDSLADSRALPDGPAAGAQSIDEQAPLGTGPNPEELPDAAEPPSAPDADLANVQRGVQSKIQPPADSAGEGNVGSNVPAAAPASPSAASAEQPGTVGMPVEPADDSAGVQPSDVPASDEAAVLAEDGRPVGKTPVPTSDDQPGEPAAGGAAGMMTAVAPDPAPAAAPEAELQRNDAGHAPAAAAADAPSGGAASDSGKLGVQPQPSEVEGQQDEEGPHGSSAGGEAVNKAADAMPAAAHKAKPVAEPLAAGGARAGGTDEASDEAEVDLPVPAPATEAGSAPSTSESAALPPAADASSDHSAIAEQLAASPAVIPADTQAEDGFTAATAPSPADSSMPSSKNAGDAPAGISGDEPLAAHEATPVTAQAAAASDGISQAAGPEGSTEQLQPGDADADAEGEGTAAAMEPKLPTTAEADSTTAGGGTLAAEPAAGPTAKDHKAPVMESEERGAAAAAAGEAASQKEPPPTVAVDDAAMPPTGDVQQEAPAEPSRSAEPSLPAEPVPEVEAAVAPPPNSELLPETQPAAATSDGTGLDMPRQPGESSMGAADEQEGMPGPDADPASVIYDEQGNKFEWRWHPEAGTAGRWKLYAAGTDTMVHEQPDDEAPAQAPVQEQSVPTAGPVHDEL